RDRAAVAVEPRLVDGAGAALLERAQARDHLCREGFVDLDLVDVREAQAAPLEERLDRMHGPEPHARRVEPRRGMRDELAPDRPALLARAPLARDDERDGAVGHGARVADGDGAVLAVEVGAELRELLERLLPADAFVAVDEAARLAAGVAARVDDHGR